MTQDETERVPEDDPVRKQIASLARNSKCRQNGFSRHRPVDWNPRAVGSPRSGLPMNDNDAWNLIAELAETGHPIQKIKLDQPEGEIGYVMIADGYANAPDIYMKVQLKGPGVIGRSFHNSKH